MCVALTFGRVQMTCPGPSMAAGLAGHVQGGSLVVLIGLCLLIERRLAVTSAPVSRAKFMTWSLTLIMLFCDAHMAH